MALKRDRDVIAYEGFVGVRDDVAAARFEPGDLAVASNVDIGGDGMLTRRAGATSVLAGEVHSMWSSGAVCLFVQDSALKRLAADYSSAALRSLTSNERMSYEGVDGRVYFSNDTDTGVLESGAVRSWGLPVPPPFSATTTVGAMPAGDYQYTMTYLRADGQESGADLATRITVPAGGGLTFTLPVPTDPAVVAKSVYLSTANGEVMYLALRTGAAVTSASYTGDTSELAIELQTQFFSAPPAGHLLGYFQGCMYVAVGDTLYHSEPYGYEWFDLRKYIPFDSKVTLFAPVEDAGVFIGTEQSIGWMAGSGPEAFKWVQLTDYGAILGALDYVDAAKFGESSNAKQLPMWLSAQGVCMGLANGSVQNLTRSRYSIAAQGTGCALFKPDLNQFVAVATH